jgi:hypothetical protein
LLSQGSVKALCCTGSGTSNPITNIDPDCKPKDYGAGTWKSMSCPSGTYCNAYTCVVKALGVSSSVTYFQGCWSDNDVATAISSAKTGDSSNGNTCYAGTVVSVASGAATSSGSTTCCAGAGASNPTMNMDASCKPKDNGAGTWKSMTCPSGTSCKAYTCVVKALSATFSVTYFQGCWTDADVTSSMASVKSGDSSNDNTC